MAIEVDFSVFKNYDFSLHVGVFALCLFMIIISQTMLQAIACVLAVVYLSHRIYELYNEHISKQN